MAMKIEMATMIVSPNPDGLITVIVSKLQPNEQVASLSLDGRDVTPAFPLFADENGELEIAFEQNPHGAARVVENEQAGL